MPRQDRASPQGRRSVDSLQFIKSASSSQSGRRASLEALLETQTGSSSPASSSTPRRSRRPSSLLTAPLEHLLTAATAVASSLQEFEMKHQLQGVWGRKSTPTLKALETISQVKHEIEADSVVGLALSTRAICALGAFLLLLVVTSVASAVARVDARLT